ncbi:DUF2391 family protein [Candidatus Woesearchaeota archaeon]|nr:DUF2391 family protein [Candidatus Woesearchaeota archaeon]
MPKKKRTKTDEKLDEVIENQEELKDAVAELQMEQLKVEHDEEEVLHDEEAQLDELQKLEELEKDIDEQVKGTPLGKITGRDFTKALIGAVFGTIGHFAFIYGTKIAHDISLTRASILYVASLILAILFMYFAGFRRIDKTALKFIPIRVSVIYITSIVVVLVVLAIFGFITSSTPWEEVFKMVSTISILAVFGASAADLLGREE